VNRKAPPSKMQTTTCKRAACGLAVLPYQRAKPIYLPSNATDASRGRPPAFFETLTRPSNLRASRVAVLIAQWTHSHHDRAFLFLSFVGGTPFLRGGGSTTNRHGTPFGVYLVKAVRSGSASEGVSYPGIMGKGQFVSLPHLGCQASNFHHLCSELVPPAALWHRHCHGDIHLPRLLASHHRRR